jgi:hypothetical protein
VRAGRVFSCSGLTDRRFPPNDFVPLDPHILSTLGYPKGTTADDRKVILMACGIRIGDADDE